MRASLLLFGNEHGAIDDPNAAEHMGIATDVGAIEVGRYGDLVAVRGNPLEDIAVLQDISVVIKGGEIVR